MEFQITPIPPMSVEALETTEIMCEIAFPESYRRFLAQHQGAKPVDGSFDIPATGRTKYIEQFLVAVDRDDAEFSWARIGVVYSQADERLTFEDAAGDLKALVPIAMLFAGDLLVFDTRQSSTEPRVAVWFHEQSAPYAPYVEDVAESFDAFLELVEIDLDLPSSPEANPTVDEEE